MKLRLKITLVISVLLVTTVIIISAAAIYVINKKGNEDLERFEKTETEKNQKNLINIVSLAMGILENDYALIESDSAVAAYIRNSSDILDADLLEMSDAVLLSKYGKETRQFLKQRMLDRIAKLRFNNGNGYFWITDDNLPYPRMIMHAEHPELNGKVMNDPKYNREKYERKNIYQKRVEIVKRYGEGFMEYVTLKEGSPQELNNLSFSKFYRPLRWIVSSGIYNDELQVLIEKQKKEMGTQVRQVILLISFSAIAILTIGLIIAMRFGNALIVGIENVGSRLKVLSEGHMVDEVKKIRKDEIGEMTSSLNALVRGNRRYVAFAKEIGEGSFDTEFKLLSEDDVLGTELLKMRDGLVANSVENEIKNWSTEGLAMFGDVLRKNNDLHELGDEILKQLSKYLKINVGVLYVVNEEDPEMLKLEMISLFAYERKKHTEETVVIGEGHDLIGECYQEKETIFLVDVPQDYITITSGLGKASPNCLALFPLLSNDVCFGVLEIASFKKLEPHEVEFVEKLSESIAATMESVKINTQTKKLLEESQLMSRELKEQEEELRQNHEEMEATQEEMRRAQIQLKKENDSLKEKLDRLREETAEGDN